MIVAFILMRTAFLTQLQPSEPRYVLVCLPALLALAAQSLRTRRWQLAPAAMPSVPCVRLSTALPACGEFRTSRSRIGPDDVRS